MQSVLLARSQSHPQNLPLLGGGGGWKRGGNFCLQKHFRISAKMLRQRCWIFWLFVCLCCCLKKHLKYYSLERRGDKNLPLGFSLSFYSHFTVEQIQKNFLLSSLFSLFSFLYMSESWFKESFIFTWWLMAEQVASEFASVIWTSSLEMDNLQLTFSCWRPFFCWQILAPTSQIMHTVSALHPGEKKNLKEKKKP